MNNDYENKRKACPYCAEMIPFDSSKCEYCDSVLDDNATNSNKAKEIVPPGEPKKNNKKMLIMIGIIAASLIIIVGLAFVFFNNKEDIDTNGQEYVKSEAETDEINIEEDEILPDDELSDEESNDIFYVNVKPGSSLFLRKTPGSKGKADSDLIEKIERNSEITLIDNHDNSVEEDGFIWWEFYNPSSGKQGWAASEFVSKGFLETYDIMDYIGDSREEFIEMFGMPNEEGGYQGSMEMYYEDLSLSLIYDPYSSDKNVIFGAYMYDECVFTVNGDYWFGKTFKDVEKVYGIPEYKGFNEMTGAYTLSYVYDAERFSMHSDSNNGPIHTVDYFINY